MKHVRPFRMPACLALLLSSLAASATAEIYRWTDPNGKVHYTERKPAEDAGGQVQSFRGEARVSFLARMFHKPCCWSKTTGLVDVRRPG